MPYLCAIKRRGVQSSDLNLVLNLIMLDVFAIGCLLQIGVKYKVANGASRRCMDGIYQLF
jgi:hypothetical protein